MTKRAYRPYGGKHARMWLGALLTLVLLFAAFLAVMAGIVFSGARTVVVGSPKLMVIFGCKVEPWGLPSQLLQNRLDTALVYLKEHPDMTVVVSGGQGPDEPMTEAQAMYDYLVAGGAKGENILLEGQSSNTWENINFTRDLLEEQDIDDGGQVLLVSNGFHLARIRMLWQRVFPGEDVVSSLAAPCSHLPSRVKMYVREPFALVKSFVFDR